MIETPDVVTTPARHTAVIHYVIPRAEMMQVWGPGMQELFGTLQAQGAAPAGAVFAHHFKITDTTFDFEMGVPVATPIAAAGRVRPGRWPAQRAARTVMHGDYAGLPGAWGEFTAWLQAAGHRGASDLWESYVVGPADTPEAGAWRTELVRPLV